MVTTNWRNFQSPAPWLSPSSPSLLHIYTLFFFILKFSILMDFLIIMNRNTKMFCQLCGNHYCGISFVIVHNFSWSEFYALSKHLHCQCQMKCNKGNAQCFHSTHGVQKRREERELFCGFHEPLKNLLRQQWSCYKLQVVVFYLKMGVKFLMWTWLLTTKSYFWWVNCSTSNHKCFSNFMEGDKLSSPIYATVYLIYGHIIVEQAFIYLWGDSSFKLLSGGDHVHG